MAIQMTNEQIKKINQKYIWIDPPNYAGMYNYIFKTFGSQMPNDQSYWFQQAAQINFYLNKIPSLFQKLCNCRLG